MASKLFFNGRSHSTPAVLSAVDDRQMAPKSLTVGNVLGLIGRCTGSEPGKIVKHGGPTEALARLKSGELCIAAVKSFAPSVDANAPSAVVTVRVGRATRASATLKDSASGDALVVRSADWGPEGNQIKVRVEGGTLRGRRVTVALKGNSYQQDNLQRDLFTLRYAGAGASATINAAPGTILLAVAGSTVANIALAEFPTIQDVVDRIAATDGFTAVVASGAARLSSGTIDRLTTVDCKTADVTAKGDLQAVIDWINSSAVPDAVAERAANAALPPANVNFTYLTGGTEPAATMEDWQNAFSALQLADVQAIVPVTGEAAVHAMASAHSLFMSTAAKRERRAFVGPGLGVDAVAVQALAKAIGDDRVAMCWPGHQDYDEAGRLVTLPGYMTAVLVAAGFAGLNPGETMTAKTLRVAGLEFTPRNPVDTDDLIQAGVLSVEDTEDGFKVVRAVSTFRGNDNYNRVEVSVGFAVDFVARNVREALKPTIGQPGDPYTLSRAVNVTDTALRELARPRPAGPGVLVGDAASPPFRNIRASLEGDVIRVEFECSPVIPVNWVAVSLNLVPYSGTATA